MTGRVRQQVPRYLEQASESQSSPALIEARSAIEQVYKRLENRRFKFSDILKVGNKSPNQLFELGSVPHSLGCLDRAGCIGATLANAGFTTYLVSERTHGRGSSYGIHFTLEVEKGGEKYTIDPRTFERHIFRGWTPGKRLSRFWLTDAEYETTQQVVKRNFIRPGSMDVPVMKLAGIHGKLHYYLLARMNLRKVVPMIRGKLKFSSKL